MRANKKVDKLFRDLMTALKESSLDRFVANGDTNFRDKTKPEMVKKVSDQLSPRIGRAHTATYLGYIVAPTFVDHLWRLKFRDKLGDRQAQLSVKDDKVHAFYIF